MLYQTGETLVFQTMCAILTSLEINLSLMLSIRFLSDLCDLARFYSAQAPDVKVLKLSLYLVNFTSITGHLFSPHRGESL